MMRLEPDWADSPQSLFLMRFGLFCGPIGGSEGLELLSRLII